MEEPQPAWARLPLMEDLVLSLCNVSLALFRTTGFTGLSTGTNMITDGILQVTPLSKISFFWAMQAAVGTWTDSSDGGAGKSNLKQLGVGLVFSLASWLLVILFKDPVMQILPLHQRLHSYMSC